MTLISCSKTLKVMVDHVKVVIKGGKARTSHEKLRALNILDRCVTNGQRNK